MYLENCPGFSVPHWRRDTDAVAVGLQRSGVCLAPFRRSPEQVLEYLAGPVGVGPADVVVDLGAGDGAVVCGAAARTGCRAVGIEVSGRLVLRARSAAAELGVSRLVRIEHELVGTRPLAGATVVFVWLLAGHAVPVVRAVEAARRAGSLRALVVVGSEDPFAALGTFQRLGAVHPLFLDRSASLASASVWRPGDQSEPVWLARF